MSSENQGAVAHDGDAHHDHPPFLAHHWESPQQQFEAGKLGMWLFLATEFLLFGGLFVAYAVVRNNRPEVFEYGSQFLDTRWGAINTVVLIASSLTMALSVSAAQLGRKRALVILLALTFLGGLGFMCIKYVEYSHKFHENIVWGTRFYEQPAGHHAEEEHLAAAPDEMHGDAERGKALWMGTCRSCHGVAGEGIAGQGKDQRGSEFNASKTDAELVAFIKVGRMPFDPLNTTGIQMPPKGGNPLLKDDELHDLVAFIRTFPDAPADAGTEVAVVGDVAGGEEEFYVPRSSIPLAAQGPPCSALASITDAEDAGESAPRPHHSVDPERPANAHVFFGIYFAMTGLHGLHVLAGMAVIAWLIMRSVRGDFGPGYFTPVDLGGLYWHVVDMIWIFLFPLLYLIG